MHQCLRGCYQWVTSGQKEIQSLDQEAIQILKAIQKSLEAISHSGQITSDMSCCVEMRQAMNQPKSVHGRNLLHGPVRPGQVLDPQC